MLLPSNPRTMPLAGRDSGAFLYVGSGILRGDLPYRDAWDHKPPIVFYIDALGLKLIPGSRWGIWLIEVVSLWAAILLGYSLLQEVFGTAPAILSTFLWVVSLLFGIGGGNLTEEYALPLQFACLWLARDLGTRRFSKWRGFALGVLCGIAFFTKQSTIGVGLAIVLIAILWGMAPGRLRSLLGDLLRIGAGFVLVAALVAGYFAARGGLTDLWDAAFVYNFYYSGGWNLARGYHALVGAFDVFRPSNFSVVAILGWAVGISVLLTRSTLLDARRSTILAIGLIDLPIEIFLVSLLPTPYGHYYVTALPAFAICGALLFQVLLAGMQFTRGPVSGAGEQVALILSLCLLVTLIQIRVEANYPTIMADNKGVGYPAVVDYIVQATQPGDTVLVWGDEAELNFFSGRRAPTRYVYQFPLVTPGYTRPEMVEQYLGDIVRNKPALIIDTTGQGITENHFGFSSAKISQSLEFLRHSYHLVGAIDGWDMFAYSGN